MFCIKLLIFLIGFNHISGSPDPLVSSSGMMSRKQPFVESENKESHLFKKDKIQKKDVNRFLDKKQVELPISEPKSTRKPHGKTKSDMVDMVGNANPITWDAGPPVRNPVKKDSIVWKSGEKSKTYAPENVVYSKKTESVLHPYVTETKFVTIPTVIITRPPAKSQILLQSIKTPDAFKYSAIEGGKTSPNESDKIIINSPNFVFVNKNQLYSDTFDELGAPTRIIRKSRNATSEEVTGKLNPNLKTKENAGIKGLLTASKLGPPWEDDEVVGQLLKDPLVRPTEVSFKVASKLCNKIASRGHSFDQPKRYYLWAPINQYIPLLRKAFPIRPPLFAPECLKWVLRQCRGTIRLPMIKPCTYWAPMPIRRPECGFNPTLQTKMVNFRLPEFVPGKCPCVWPCTKQFDPVQRCRIAVDQSEHQLDHIDSDGDPTNNKEIVIQENLAEQLCRGMKIALTGAHTIPIGWIPIRVDVASGANGESKTDQESKGTQKEIIQNGTLKVKREKIFLNPEKVSRDSSSSSEEVDTAKLGGQKTNKTRLLKCKVWKYQGCPKNQMHTDTFGYKAYQPRNLRRGRNKRNLRPYMSGLAANDKSSKRIDNIKRLVRQSGYDDDDDGFEKDCGEWIQSEFDRCIPEESIKITKSDAYISTEDDSQEQKKKSARKIVQKDLCPGTVGKFPCFLRKKRSVLDATKDAQGNSEAGIGAHEPENESIYLINKILIQPDPSCMCEWPCLPFFDRVNKCYNSEGKLFVDNLGRPKITDRSFRKTQRDPVVCINFVESDEIYCKIKK